MSLCGYIQLFLIGLICSGAVSLVNAKCGNPQPLSNVESNKVHGEWMVVSVIKPDNATVELLENHWLYVLKINETTLVLAATVYGKIEREVFSIENAENAGTWHRIDGDDPVKVYVTSLSEDGKFMVISYWAPYLVDPVCALLFKVSPISSELDKI